MRQVLSALFICLLSALPALAEGIAAADVPASKRTSLGKYLDAKQAYATVVANKPNVLFLDVRTLAELTYVGSTNEIDFQIPFAEVAEPRVWDFKGNRLKIVPNDAFVADVESALTRKNLTKDSKVVIICRSGERSARAVEMLAKAGFSDAWSVVDGFEGDLSKDGFRSVNGWKNAGLPWSYKLDKSKLSTLSAPGTP